MPGRFVRSKIAELVAETVGSRQARENLKEHGWTEGMPIVIAQHDEKLTDIMALVVVHQPPVLIATLDPENGNLCFTYVIIGCSDLELVAPYAEDKTIKDLYLDASAAPSITFRVTPLMHSALAHAIPPMRGVSGVKYPGLPTAAEARPA